MSGTVYQSKTKKLQPEAALKSGLILRKEILNNTLSRLVDLLASGLGLLLLSPFFLLIGMTIKRESPGPIFYHGKHAGKGGKPFWILKFRTLFEDQDSYNGPKVTAQDDPRVTPQGSWLRHTKLNELPQLWNVLKGEMSLVGPRPEDYDIAMAWSEEVQNEVLAVRPGVTSPTSVVYRDEESLLSQEGLMDSYLNQALPVEQASLWLDGLEKVAQSKDWERLGWSAGTTAASAVRTGTDENRKIREAERQIIKESL